MGPRWQLVPYHAVTEPGGRIVATSDNIEPGAACLEIERRAFLPDGRAVEFTRSIYRGDAYDFAAELNAAPA